MLVGLCGLKGSGKDTVAAYLVKQHNFERRAFADPLKKSVAALFDIPFSEVDKLKDEALDARIVLKVAGINAFSKDPKGWTFRNFLQRYGTEAHRDVPEMGNDFWVDLTLPHNGYYAGRSIVVSDVRFENEARRIRYLQGVVVEVARPGLVNNDPHRSEQLVDVEPDYTIFNNGSIEDLNKGVELMLEKCNSTDERIKRIMR